MGINDLPFEGYCTTHKGHVTPMTLVCCTVQKSHCCLVPGLLVPAVLAAVVLCHVIIYCTVLMPK